MLVAKTCKVKSVNVEHNRLYPCTIYVNIKMDRIAEVVPGRMYRIANLTRLRKNNWKQVRFRETKWLNIWNYVSDFFSSV